MGLNSKQKPLCQLATTELYPNNTKKRVTAENDKVTFGSDDALMFFFNQPRGPLFLSLMITNCPGESFFQDSEELRTK